MSDFDFPEALSFLKEGRKISRSGWNGKGMWLVMANGTAGKVIGMHDGTDYFNAGLKEVCIDPHVDMYTAQGTMQPGWLPSQADLFADDWGIIE